MKKIDYEILCKVPTRKENEKYYYFYKIINKKNDKYYYGVHSTKILNDGYSGSSKILKRDIKSQGIADFKKLILKFFENSDEMYQYEERFVTKEIVLQENCYNMHTGGSGSWDFTIGRVCVKDASGNTMMVDKNDASYISGDLVSNMKGMVHVTTKSGENKTITKEEYYLNKDKFSVAITGHVLAKDKNGTRRWIKREDFEQLKETGEVVGLTKNNGVFKDKYGNTLMCSTTDERVLTGEVVGATKGTGVYKYKNDFSKTVSTTKDDPRVLSGELVGINYGIVHCIDPNTKENFSVMKDDPRLKSGEIISWTKYRNMVGGVKHSSPKGLDYYEEKYPVAMECIKRKEGWREISEKTGLGKKKINYLRGRYKKITENQQQTDTSGRH